MSSSFTGTGDALTVDKLKEQIKQQTAINNARQLIEKLNGHCFDRCVPKPGSSLSSSETTCHTTCMEKYMSVWNTTSRALIGRLQSDAAGGHMVGI